MLTEFYFLLPNLQDNAAVEEAVQLADIILADSQLIEPLVFVSGGSEKQ